MAFVRLAFFPRATAAHYDALAQALEGAPSPEDRLVFAAGARDGGLQVVQVWRTQEALESFNRDWLLPAMSRLGAAGFPSPPQVTDFETRGLEIRADGHPRPDA